MHTHLNVNDTGFVWLFIPTHLLRVPLRNRGSRNNVALLFSHAAIKIKAERVTASYKSAHKHVSH